jgi:hypothetical protein
MNKTYNRILDLVTESVPLKPGQTEKGRASLMRHNAANAANAANTYKGYKSSKKTMRTPNTVKIGKAGKYDE